MKIKNTKHSIAVGNLTQEDKQMSAVTVYTIKYTTMNSMQPGASFLVKFPHTVRVPRELLKPSGDLLTCEVIYLGLVYNMQCPVDSEERLIKVHTGLNSVYIPEGASLEVRLGLIENPSTPLSVSTF